MYYTVECNECSQGVYELEHGAGLRVGLCSSSFVQSETDSARSSEAPPPLHPHIVGRPSQLDPRCVHHLSLEGETAVSLTRSHKGVCKETYRQYCISYYCIYKYVHYICEVYNCI